MRLEKVRSGHKLRHQLLLKVIRVVSGSEPVDVIKTLLYRPTYFGTPFSAAVQASLRGPSSWSVGERELFAAFVSRLNKCLF